MTTPLATARRGVLVIGPSPEETGGMASVVEQTLTLDYDGRYRAELLAFTTSPGEEGTTDRVGRHMRQFATLSRRIRDMDAAVVHLHTCSGFSFYRSVADMMLARRLGCRAVLHIHGAAFDRFYAEAAGIQQRMIRWGLAAADAVIALSGGWSRELRAMSPRANVVVLENAVDMPPPRLANPHDGPCRFVMLARLDLWKGIDDLLDAMAVLRGRQAAVELALAGPEGTAGDDVEIRRKIAALGLEGVVRYVGTVRQAGKRHLLRWADAYVQPSHQEGLPIAVLEALAGGLPIVATRVGALPEVIEQGVHGLLVDAHAPPALADAMETIASNAGLRTSMAAAARELAVRRFSTARLRSDLLALYDDLLSGSEGERRERVDVDAAGAMP
jgi:glycosyltransferase involved in cell wall biosynthesis